MLALDLIVSIISFGDNGANDEVPGLTIDSGDVIYSGMSIIIPMITEKLLLVSIFKLKYIYKKKGYLLIPNSKDLIMLGNKVSANFGNFVG